MVSHLKDWGLIFSVVILILFHWLLAGTSRTWCATQIHVGPSDRQNVWGDGGELCILWWHPLVPQRPQWRRDTAQWRRVYSALRDGNLHKCRAQLQKHLFYTNKYVSYKLLLAHVRMQTVNCRLVQIDILKLNHFNHHPSIFSHTVRFIWLSHV